MADSFFKVVIRDPKWDVRTEAKRLGFLFQLFIDAKKPTDVFVKYKSAKDAAKARASLAENENVLRIESMDEWNIRPKKQAESKQAETNGASALPAGSTAQSRSPAKSYSAAPNNMSMPMPMQMQMPMGSPGMFSVCAACRNNGASFQCFICGIFYCGEQCQRSDWPSHIVQCIPRLVRATNPFVANVPQMNVPLPFNGMFNGLGNNWHGNRENTQSRESYSNGSVVGSSKRPAQEMKKTVTDTSPKVTPPCNVPTNVLKSMATKRHQEQAGPSNAMKAGEPNVTAKANETKPAKEGGSKLLKRVQQKTAPKRIIQYASDKLRQVAEKEKSAEEAKLAAAVATIAVKEASPRVEIPDPASYVPVTADDIIEHDMQMGKDVLLMIVEASELDTLNQLTVILKSDSIQFASILNECEQLGSADPNPYQPEAENVVFLLHFEGIWCRALLASLDDEIQYYLLDLGIIRTLNGKPECRRYPAGLTRKMFACECIVDKLLGVFNGKEDKNIALRGKLLNATVYQITEEENEATHIKISSIGG
uniref:MYND-type domain-containing protein n=1 Tax=Anopheles christyi TaxID=43041 RepID=A0A182JXC3_9DIPT